MLVLDPILRDAPCKLEQPELENLTSTTKEEKPAVANM